MSWLGRKRRLSRKERRIALLVTPVVCVIVLAVFGSIAAWLLFAVAATWVLVLAGNILRGAVARCDLMRTARRGRFALLRSAYAFILLLILFFLYLNWFSLNPSEVLTDLMAEQRIASNEQARFARSFFQTFLVSQYVILILLTPAFVAPAISEEREKRTLPDLLTTELTGREIIAGKLVARIANLVLILLAGIPILALLQLFGGVDSAFLVAVVFQTFCTVVSVAAVCLFCSSWIRQTRNAVLIAYLISLSYLIYMATVTIMLLAMTAFISQSISTAAVVSSGYFYLSLGYLEAAALDGTLTEALPFVLLWNLLFHGGMTWLFLFWTRRQLRKALFNRSTAEEEEIVELTAADEVRSPSLKEVSPIAWKDRNFTPGFFQRVYGDDFALAWYVIGLSFAVVIFLFVLFMVLVGEYEELNRLRYAPASICIPVVVTVVLLRQMSRAAGSISIEREQQTLESLLTTDLTNDEILGGKWRASIGSLWRPGVVLAAFFLIGMLTLSIHPFGIPLMLLAITVYMLLAINLGLYCSLSCRTTGRATTATIILFLGILHGHWALFQTESAVATMLNAPEWIGLLETFHSDGLTPPATLSTLASLGVSPEHGFQPKRLGAALIGTGLYAALAGLLWLLAKRRFEQLAGRRT